MYKDAATVLGLIEAVSTDASGSMEKLTALLEDAKKYHYCRVVGPMCWISEISAALEGSGVGYSAPIATPTTVGETTQTKIEMARECIQNCKIPLDIDMVLNLFYINSGRYDLAQRDIAEVRKAFPNNTLKVVIEAPMLSDETLDKTCRLVKDAGADYIKTSTGATGHTTVELVKKIRDSVGYDIGIKAAGGIRDLQTVRQLMDLGVDRIGMNYLSARQFAESLMAMEG